MIEEQWVKNDIEELSTCPLCLCNKSSVLLNSLVDTMVPKRSDKWTLNKCTECGVAYLSPRPKKGSIHKAYSNYYTHGDENGMIKKGKTSIFINYLKLVIYKVKYKRDYSFIDFFLYSFILITYPIHLFLDAKIRHIGIFTDNNNRLLDIGCGNGDFLVFSKDLGWDVMGLDVDQNAVNSALSKGVNVQSGGIESLNKEDMFDMITLNHVIEHVYNPVELIQECYKHLNPAGKLWIETPNINSIGLSVYKEYWRGLEPPRHLILYNACTLTKLLSDAGFLSINQKTHGLSGVYMGLQSEKNIAEFMRNSRFFNSVFQWPRILFVEIVQLLFKNKSEFITLIAYK